MPSVLLLKEPHLHRRTEITLDVDKVEDLTVKDFKPIIAEKTGVPLEELCGCGFYLTYNNIIF